MTQEEKIRMAVVIGITHATGTINLLTGVDYITVAMKNIDEVMRLLKDFQPELFKE